MRTVNRRLFTNALMGAALLNMGESGFTQTPQKLNTSANLDLTPQNTDLYLLIGQSNMSGRGMVEDQDRVVHERVFNFNRDGQVVAAVDPLHFDKPKVCGVGPARTFGIEVAKTQTKRNVILVPCAVGGTSIDTWQEGAYDQDTRTHPFDDMLQRVKRASALGHWRAVLWHQGSSDANEKKSSTYHTKMLKLVADVRAVIDGPEVPFLIGQMLNDPIKPWNNYFREVDEAHQRVCAELPAMAYVSSAGLKAKINDIEHFDSFSARELGVRYAQHCLKMIKT
jgi:Carbohydrate esterase, sialic acid-specific acetylesterase